MKSGIAAMCVAAREAAREGIDGEVVVACVIDEEYESLGTRALLERGIRVDAAIVTEPTRLAICPAHRGFVWADLAVHGRAAHGSRYDVGVDAITHASMVIAELDRIQRNELSVPSHPLLGRPSLHASTIRGGTGYSTYPDACVVSVERRTIPGEDVATVRDEVARAIEAVRASYPDVRVDVHIVGAQAPSDVAMETPVVRALEAGLRSVGHPVRIEGMSAWTDCALLNEAGIPAVCFGPGDLSLAHSAEEFVAIQEIDEAARVLRHVIRSWCNGGGAAGVTGDAQGTTISS